MHIMYFLELCIFSKTCHFGAQNRGNHTVIVSNTNFQNRNNEVIDVMHYLKYYSLFKYSFLLLNITKFYFKLCNTIKYDYSSIRITLIILIL